MPCTTAARIRKSGLRLTYECEKNKRTIVAFPDGTPTVSQESRQCPHERVVNVSRFTAIS